MRHAEPDDDDDEPDDDEPILPLAPERKKKPDPRPMDVLEQAEIILRSAEVLADPIRGPGPQTVPAPPVPPPPGTPQRPARVPEPVTVRPPVPVPSDPVPVFPGPPPPATAPPPLLPTGLEGTAGSTPPHVGREGRNYGPGELNYGQGALGALVVGAFVVVVQALRAAGPPPVKAALIAGTLVPVTLSTIERAFTAMMAFRLGREGDPRPKPDPKGAHTTTDPGAPRGTGGFIKDVSQMFVPPTADAPTDAPAAPVTSE